MRTACRSPSRSSGRSTLCFAVQLGRDGVPVLGRRRCSTMHVGQPSDRWASPAIGGRGRGRRAFTRTGTGREVGGGSTTVVCMYVVFIFVGCIHIVLFPSLLFIISFSLLFLFDHIAISNIADITSQSTVIIVVRPPAPNQEAYARRKRQHLAVLAFRVDVAKDLVVRDQALLAVRQELDLVDVHFPGRIVGVALLHEVLFVRLDAVQAVLRRLDVSVAQEPDGAPCEPELRALLVAAGLG